MGNASPDIMMRDKDYDKYSSKLTLLAWASKEKLDSIVSLLLEYGAKIHLDPHEENLSGFELTLGRRLSA